MTILSTTKNVVILYSEKDAKKLGDVHSYFAIWTLLRKVNWYTYTLC